MLRDSAEGKNAVNSLASAQKLADEARKLYLIEYADKWDAFMRDVRARPVNGLEDAAILARQLSDPSSPLANLVRFAARETSMTGTNQAMRRAGSIASAIVLNSSGVTSSARFPASVRVFVSRRNARWKTVLSCFAARVSAVADHQRQQRSAEPQFRSAVQPADHALHLIARWRWCPPAAR